MTAARVLISTRALEYCQHSNTPEEGWGIGRQQGQTPVIAATDTELSTHHPDARGCLDRHLVLGSLSAFCRTHDNIGSVLSGSTATATDPGAVGMWYRSGGK